MPNDRPTVAIPDLNGTLPRFHRALTFAAPASHHLILLGDVIDHGPDARALLSELRAIHREHHLQYLAGNHEELLINAIYGPPGQRHAPSAKPTDAPEWRKWLKNGGQASLDSYRSSKDLLSDAEWIRTTAKRWIVRGGWLYSHASRPAPAELRYSELAAAQQGFDTLLWQRPRVSSDLPSLDAALVGSVHGHTPRTAPEQLLGPDRKPAWFIDLGRTTRQLALHHSETGVHLLDGTPAPLTLSTPLHLPTLETAGAFLTRIGRTPIGPKKETSSPSADARNPTLH